MIARITLFVAGFIIAWALLGLLPIVKDTHWILLAPFLVAVGIFAILASVFVLDARKLLHDAEDGAIGNLQESLGLVKEAFDADTKQLLKDMEAALATRVRQGEIVFEQDFEDDRKQSRCYRRLIDLVDSAQHSLFAIPNPYRRGASDVLELDWRDEYLRRIETKLADMSRDAKDFEYVRIQQVKRGADDKPLTKQNLSNHMGEIEFAHVERLREQGSGDIKLMVIDNDEITGQLVIDEKTFVNLISAVDQKGRKRMVAIAIMTDPLSDSVGKYYRKLRSTLVSKATLISDLPNN